jgi:FKBP-type peptidyl-prolyl cis-trans isomerase
MKTLALSLSSFSASRLLLTSLSLFLPAQLMAAAAEIVLAPPQSTPSFNSLDERFSYAYGVDLAKKFKAEGITLDIDLLAAAMKSVFAEQQPYMDDGEVQATIQAYQQVFTKKKEAEWAEASTRNKQQGDEFLRNNIASDGVQVTDSGLQYKIIQPGTGDYHPKADDEVLVHYRARFVDNTEFDSTYDRDKPYSVKVKQLIPGWSEALQLMTKGARWELYLPSDIAYGERGSGEFVGPNAVLIFDVELLDIKS